MKEKINNLSKAKKTILIAFTVVVTLAALLGTIYAINNSSDKDDPKALKADITTSDTVTTPKVTVPPITSDEPINTKTTIIENGEVIEIQSNQPPTETKKQPSITTVPPKATESPKVTTTIPKSTEKPKVTTTTKKKVDSNGFPVNPSDDEVVVVKGQEYIWDWINQKWRKSSDYDTSAVGTISPEREAEIEANPDKDKIIGA